MRAGADPLILNKKGKNALEFLQEELGDDGWEFGMKEILVTAIDARKLQLYHNSVGESHNNENSSILSGSKSQSSSKLAIENGKKSTIKEKLKVNQTELRTQSATTVGRQLVVKQHIK